MIKTNRFSNVFAQNSIDPLLTFDNSSTWTVSSGTGSATLDNTAVFVGENALKLENTAPTTDLTVTNSVQASYTLLKSGETKFSLALFKDASSDSYQVDVEVFKDAVSLGTHSAVLETTDDAQWFTFVSDTAYTVAKGEKITFTFTFKGDAEFVGNKVVYVDGLMLYNNKEGEFAPPFYNKPVATLQDITESGAITTEDVTVADLTADQFNLSALNTAPSSASDTGTTGEIRVVADYIYVCTATDTWVRTALATW